MGRHQPIIYNHVLLNHGNAYNKVNGEFTVPMTGVYYLNGDKSRNRK
ncbi:hypothetical protein KUTeg_000239 [Tegillarca granosa]|uniref:C1q domain-containing protein n=1 Tax=Tegillarca granosa TaxID=220873 RepID=A0ABQ9FWZ4_TEGGR|nr:hypothetical protein KUTeg_000239 [Tegillarca granosa]